MELAEQKNPYEPIPWEIVIDWMRALDVSARTKEAYELGLRTFCAFVLSCGIDFDELTGDDVTDFKMHLKNERRLSAATVSSYLAGVRSFFRYSEDRGIENVAKNVKGDTPSKGHKKEALTLEQAKALLAHLRTNKKSTEQEKRDYAMINLMLRIGLRDIEVSRANVGDIKEKSGVKVIYLHGKGRSGKDDFEVLEENALSPIEDYLKERPGRKDEDPLFTSTAYVNKGDRLSTRTISKIAKRALSAIGLTDERYTAHSLRHTTVTLALLGGATEREVQEMARHANISTTLIYSHDLNRLERAAEFAVGRMLDSD